MPSKSKTKTARKLKGGLSTAVQGAKALINSSKKPSPSEMRDALLVYFQANNYDPVQELIAMAQGQGYVETVACPTEQDPQATREVERVPTVSERMSIHKEFLRYVAPGMKVTDPHAHEGANIQVTINNFGDTPPAPSSAPKPAINLDQPNTEDESESTPPRQTPSLLDQNRSAPSIRNFAPEQAADSEVIHAV